MIETGERKERAFIFTAWQGWTWLVALLLTACGGTAPASAPATATGEAVDPREVHLAADASVADLLGALRRALIAGGHEGECFLAWGVEAEREEDRITVHVGDRSRSAALSCNGFDAIGPTLEGRCPFVRLFWITGRDMRTEALTFFFAPAGRSYALRPIGASDIAVAAENAVFTEGPEGTVLVLGVPLRNERSDGARGKQGAPETESAPEEPEDPLADPEIRRGVEQLVARIQRCNPDGEGSLVLEWSVAPDGSIGDVQPLTASVSDDVIECAVETLAEVSFPEHEGDHPVDYCVPVLLDPSLRPAPSP